MQINARNKPIGIFDSGVGGLTVLREIEKILPSEDIIYFGDTARVPYGNKSKSTIIKFSTENVLFLLKRKVKMVVIACNTSSALALDYFKKNFSAPVIGVIEAGAKKAIGISKNNRIGVIGTRSTINSGSYRKEIAKRNRNAKVYSKACPLFVPLVEEAILSGSIVNSIVRMYLEEIKAKNVDTVILGCTHYPLLKEPISKYLKGVCIIDSAKEVAVHTKNLLDVKKLNNRAGKKGKVDFYVSDEPKGFRKLAKLFLKRDIPTPKVVDSSH
ncbi:MAG: glutamate racemase [Candidatus Omnitrophota bacterium]|nr:glutamate racemase [Candidatus Omnitrophota bacterium]